MVGNNRPRADGRHTMSIPSATQTRRSGPRYFAAVYKPKNSIKPSAKPIPMEYRGPEKRYQAGLSVYERDLRSSGSLSAHCLMLVVARIRKCSKWKLLCLHSPEDIYGCGVN